MRDVGPTIPRDSLLFKLERVAALPAGQVEHRGPVVDVVGVVLVVAVVVVVGEVDVVGVVVIVGDVVAVVVVVSVLVPVVDGVRHVSTRR